MGNDVPLSVRTSVRQRAHHRCERCQVPTPHGAIHHRRSRSVRDQHTHCQCNCVYLCHTCHRDVHAHPFNSSKDGWIVSRHVLEPTAVSLHSPTGEWVLDCTGGATYRFSPTNTEVEQP
jgi:hypothetical protein